MRYRLDHAARRFDGGRVVLGGVPGRLFRLSDAGAAWVDRLVSPEEPCEPSTPGEVALLERLTSSGVLHPDPDPALRGHRRGVTMVVPVRDRAAALADLLDSVRRSGDEPDEIIVVDDGSTDGTAHRRVAEAHGARCLRAETPHGPGGARNLGLEAASHPIVVFVDSDVTVTPGWIAGLSAHLADAQVVAVAGRVRSAAVPGWIGDYEQRNGPLDLGADPGPVGPGRRIGHVPAALLMVRRDAAADGFDATMRVGEDVDLVWRLTAAGGVVRYEPQVECHHSPREDLRSWVAQRFAYGTSAAALDERHPGSVAPWRSSWSSLAVAAAALAGHPFAAVLVATGTALPLVRRLSGVPQLPAVRIGLEGHVAAGASFARASIRVWWPLVLLALALRPTRRPAARLFAAAVAVRWWNRGAPLPVRDVPLAVTEDVAYGAGVWTGCWRRCRWGPLVPSVNP
ncbi:MAG: mycofactocin biosynthesis glycosyltransferase MftF [Actinomycetota bacterium]